MTTFQVQYGDPMDQNADGTADQNPLTTAFTGLTPGDVYAVPTPQPTVAGHVLHGAASILSPPFNQNTLPLIVPGPQVVEHRPVPGGTGDRRQPDHRRHDSSLNVTFDRPMQVSTFTPGQVLQIMGPTGSISGPQYFPSDSIGQTIPAATSAGPGTLDSTLTIPSFDGTFKIARTSRSSSTPRSRRIRRLTAVLIAPDGTHGPLVLGRGRHRRELRQHRLRRLGGDLDHRGHRPLHRDVPARATR